MVSRRMGECSHAQDPHHISIILLGTPFCSVSIIILAAAADNNNDRLTAFDPGQPG